MTHICLTFRLTEMTHSALFTNSALCVMRCKMARTDPQLRIRLPANLKAWIAAEAMRNGASLNSEVIRSVRERMERVAPVPNPATVSVAGELEGVDHG
ncbi:Arc family DNA-binding protein [Xanthobacter aminoxidans]|uniref:Arc family DNA-binding protein n=1 Tax=Xanthobacter aminoxidans TaxID=186280 RepID=UPI00372D1779